VIGLFLLKVGVVFCLLNSEEQRQQFHASPWIFRGEYSLNRPCRWMRLLNISSHVTVVLAFAVAAVSCQRVTVQSWYHHHGKLYWLTFHGSFSDA